MSNPAPRFYPIPRAQLALFLPNEKLIQDFEQQQEILTGELPDAVEQAQATADAAQATADVALLRLTNSGFLLMVANPALANGRTLAVSSDFVLTDAGPGGLASLALNQRTVVMPGDVADVTANFVNATGLFAPLAANSTYLVEGALTFQSAGLAVGLGLAFSLPAAASIVGAFSHNATATAAQTAYNNGAGIVSGNTTAVPVINTDLPISGRWIIKTGVSAGNAQLLFRTGTAATAVTLRGGLSALSFRKIA